MKLQELVNVLEPVKALLKNEEWANIDVVFCNRSGSFEDMKADCDMIADIEYSFYSNMVKIILE